MGSRQIIQDIVLNYTAGRNYNLSYVVEDAPWSIRQDGEYITAWLNRQNLLKARPTTSSLGLRNQIVHYGSLNTFLGSRGPRLPHRSNRTVLTIFHLNPRETNLKTLVKASVNINIIHTSSSITKKKLADIGIPGGKITVIPLGVDLASFRPPTAEEKQTIKKELGMPPQKIVIGSFQKDGQGWGSGLEPKLIKGPDIFLEAVNELNKRYPVFVLLSGPARGYVKEGLKKINASHLHLEGVKSPDEIAQLYRTLDIYLIASRIEGGPKQILEAWASGVPVVSTRVGMVVDIANDRKNALLADVENVKQITKAAEEIIENENLKNDLIAAGLQSVKNYSWDIIARRYFDEIYRKL